ncbi:hypothetical protein GCM10018781_03090 [Kitasatospora indigofera]|uniref:Uncharacterized protein n=1 Tax=Kitasatospora indigofera TaxID=67307 RepID=A0A919FB32_9ACTN|nr:hypothetical protein GCM10018781_03090 [Kitasatospora indigofera]
MHTAADDLVIIEEEHPHRVACRARRTVRHHISALVGPSARRAEESWGESGPGAANSVGPDGPMSG